MFQRGHKSESNASKLNAKLKRFDSKSKQLQVRSEQLQKENDEMEQRIVALRQMMQREREERERQGGSRWKSSQTGQNASLPSAKPDKKPAKPKGQPKFKVLSDKPVEQYKTRVLTNKAPEAPQRSSCGQCEAVRAKLECVDCGELFCPPCFKQFHSKGAMRKHAWQPLDQGRPFSSNAKAQGDDETRGSTSHDSFSGQTSSREIEMENEESSPKPGGSLLEGAYNEVESAASFQEALREWRSGSFSLPSQKHGMWVNPVEEEPKLDTKSCETETDRAVLPGPPPDIQLNFDSTLSYADRLMLKKHKKNPDATAAAYNRPGNKHNLQTSPKSGPKANSGASPKASRRSLRIGKFKGKDSSSRPKPPASSPHASSPHASSPHASSPRASSPREEAGFSKALQIQLLPSDEDESKYGSSDQEGTSPIINYVAEEQPSSRKDRSTLSQMGRLAIVELSFSDPENDSKAKDVAHTSRVTSYSSLSLKRAASGTRNQPVERSRTTPPHGVYSPSTPSNTYVARQKILMEKNRRGFSGTESCSSKVKKVLKQEDRKWKPADKYVGLDSFFMAGVEKENLENTSGASNRVSRSPADIDSKNFPTISVGLADSWRPESSLSQVEEQKNVAGAEMLYRNAAGKKKAPPHGIRVTVENHATTAAERGQAKKTDAKKGSKNSKSELTTSENGTPRVSMTDFDFLSAMPPMSKGDDLHKLHRASTVTLFALSPQPPDVWNDDSELEILNTPQPKASEDSEQHGDDEKGEINNETDEDLALKALAKDILPSGGAAASKGVHRETDNNWEDDSLSIEDNDAGSGLTSSADGDTCYDSEDSDLDFEKRQVLNLK